MVRPSRGSDDHVNGGPVSARDVKHGVIFITEQSTFRDLYAAPVLKDSFRNNRISFKRVKTRSTLCLLHQLHQRFQFDWCVLRVEERVAEIRSLVTSGEMPSDWKRLLICKTWLNGAEGTLDIPSSE